MGAVEARYPATARLAEEPKAATYTHAYAESGGFLALLCRRQPGFRGLARRRRAWD